MTTSASLDNTPTQPLRQPASVKVLTALGLGSDMPAIEGKELRLQLTTYAPGAVGTPHSHAGKVEVVYVQSGAIIEHHGDGRDVTYNSGDVFSANKDTFHHLENAGAVPAELLVAMIVDTT
jgi:quercetin dioxygenase-like cupin family protein